MNQQEYVDAVFAAAGFLTGQEKAAIQKELEDHMTDHMEGLLQQGWDEPSAKARALAAMGDPTAVGRQLRAEYPFRWVLLALAGRVVTVLMALVLLGAGSLEISWDIPGYLHQRFFPVEESTLTTVFASYPVGESISLGNDILRLNTLWLGEKDGIRTVEIQGDAYDRRLFGVVGWQIELTAENQAGEREKGWQTSPETRHDGGRLDRWLVRIPVEEGDEYVTLSVRRYRQEKTLRLSLPEVTP